MADAFGPMHVRLLTARNARLAGALRELLDALQETEVRIPEKAADAFRLGSAMGQAHLLLKERAK